MAGSIELRRDGHAAVLTMANEARRNALSLAMWRMLPTLVAEASADPDIRVLVLQGAGPKAFCAGADISEFCHPARYAGAGRGLRDRRRRALNDARCLRRSRPSPPFAGICFGGGLELALACDLRLAEEHARSSACRGPGSGLGYTLRRSRCSCSRIGYAATAEIMFAGRAFGAADALRFGVVQDVHPGAAFETERDALVEHDRRQRAADPPRHQAGPHRTGPPGRRTRCRGGRSPRRGLLCQLRLRRRPQGLQRERRPLFQGRCRDGPD